MVDVERDTWESVILVQMSVMVTDRRATRTRIVHQLNKVLVGVVAQPSSSEEATFVTLTLARGT